MSEVFIAGGWGMYPTFIAGLALLAASLRYASRPDPRYVPLMVSLGLFTLLAGSLGFVTGLMQALLHAEGLQATGAPPVLYLGIQEALHNTALALLMTTVSALAASVGAWRLLPRARA
jgi:hypothetical protein